MRLVNCHTLRLEEFVEGQTPRYAILSHRWGDEGLTFKEIYKNRADVRKRGYEKMKFACHIAAADYHLDYLWIDTCCIDKRSSAELSESINSMFAWYRNSDVCLAYLEDVGPGFMYSSHKESVWYTRSWTLQELLAPRRVEFYGGEWDHIGSKHSLAHDISEVTGIRISILDGSQAISDCLVAERMSWAAERKATRTEDVAYSLLGIFGVNLGLLYGEGMKAFRRLQEEILRHSSDPTMLLFDCQDSDYVPGQLVIDCSILAESPDQFITWRELAINHAGYADGHVAFGITNSGLEIAGFIVRWDLNTYCLPLAICESHTFIALFDKSSKQTAFTLSQATPAEGCMRKVGIFRVEWRRRPMSLYWDKFQKIIVAWGSLPNDPVPPHVLEKYRHPYVPTEPVSHKMRITTNMSRSTLLPVYQPGLDSPYSAPEYSNESSFTWNFGDLRREVFATMELHLSKSKTWLMELSFDFDGIPCCLIYQTNLALRDLVWKQAHTLPHVKNHCDDMSVFMNPIPNASDNKETWFLRGLPDTCVTVADVPLSVTGKGSCLWVVFHLESRDLYCEQSNSHDVAKDMWHVDFTVVDTPGAPFTYGRTNFVQLGEDLNYGGTAIRFDGGTNFYEVAEPTTL